MVLATFSDYVGFSILWAMPFFNASKTCLMLRSVSQTLSGRPLDMTDKRLEEKVKKQNSVVHEQMCKIDLKIYEVWNPFYVYVAGTSLFKKKSVMFVTPGLDLVDNDVFEWLYKHEAYYVINRSFLKTQTIKALSVMISAIVFNLIFKYSFSFSILYTAIVGFFIDMMCSHVIENRADSFAIANSSLEELKGAVHFLKAAKEESKKKTFFQKLIAYLMHPSYSFRIKRVKKALAKQKVDFFMEEEKLSSLRKLLEKNNLEEQIFIEAKKQQVLRWIDADED